MRSTLQHSRAAAAAACAVLVLGTTLVPANANWLTRVLKEAGEAGGAGAGKVAKLGVPGLDDAAAALRALPDGPGKTAFAAHATSEGHWKFVNRDGDVFTAGTPAEMKRIADVLAPDAATGAGIAAEGKLTLYLSEATVFERAAAIKDLPGNARLHVVSSRDTYPLLRRGAGSEVRLYAEVRPNLVAATTDLASFREAIWRLTRPLDRSRVRVLALEPGGPDALTSMPRVDAATGHVLVDALDPGSLANGFKRVSGQTVLVTGRIEGSVLYYRPAGAFERALPLDDLTKAAAQSDVDLVILNAAQPRQPGGRNWLWQKVSVTGLDVALKRATVADFLDAIAAGRGELAVAARTMPDGRVKLTLTPSGETATPLTGRIGDWLTEIVSNVTGDVVTNAIEIHGPSADTQKERDRRIIPGISADAQLVYIVNIVLGIIGLGVARGWFKRLWPLEQRGEYSGLLGFMAARATRLMAFALVFLPVVGLPAFVVTIAMQCWNAVMLPFRWIWRIFGRKPAAG